MFLGFSILEKTTLLLLVTLYFKDANKPRKLRDVVWDQLLPLVYLMKAERKDGEKSCDMIL